MDYSLHLLSRKHKTQNSTKLLNSFYKTLRIWKLRNKYSSPNTDSCISQYLFILTADSEIFIHVSLMLTGKLEMGICCLKDDYILNISKEYKMNTYFCYYIVATKMINFTWSSVESLFSFRTSSGGQKKVRKQIFRLYCIIILISLEVYIGTRLWSLWILGKLSTHKIFSFYSKYLNANKQNSSAS